MTLASSFPFLSQFVCRARACSGLRGLCHAVLQCIPHFMTSSLLYISWHPNADMRQSRECTEALG